MALNNNLPIENVINVTIQETPPGIGIPNVNNMMLLTTESPINLEVFGNYFSLQQVGENFGTDSVTYQMAANIFGQTPNILSGTGNLSIAKFTGVSATSATFTTPSIIANLADLINVSNGDLRVTVNGAVQNLHGLNFTKCLTLADIAAVIDAATIDCVVTATSTAIKITSNKVGTGSTMAVAANAAGGTDLTVSNLLNTTSGTAVSPGSNSSGETILTAIARLLPQTFFASVITNLNIEDAVISTTAAAIQAMKMMFLHHIATTGDITGIATTVSDAGQKKTRLLPYLTGGQAVANLYKAAYAGRGFCQDVTGSDTSFTMHMKQLANVVPDPGMSQSVLIACQEAGCDPYVTIQGYPMIYSTGANDYFDNQYINLALQFALEVAGFNYLAQTNTKVPQTEVGMNGLKSAYTTVLQQFITNGALAPGAWNSAETFANPQVFRDNITALGFYVYSAPVALQSSAARNARQAPLVQIAAKRSGAIQESNVIVTINA